MPYVELSLNIHQELKDIEMDFESGESVQDEIKNQLAHTSLCGDYFCERRFAFFRRANDREDAVARTGWHAGCLEHLHGIFPGSTACRLWLRANCLAVAAVSAGGPATRISLLALVSLPSDSRPGGSIQYRQPAIRHCGY